MLRKILLAIPLLSVIVFSGCEEETEPGSYAKPTIESLSPNNGLIGSEVKIQGTGLKNVINVMFADIPANNFAPANNTDTEITVTVPAGLDAGLIQVAVYYKGATETNLGPSANAPFTVLFAPVISLVTPVEAKPTKLVTINGQYLAGVTSVSFGDLAVPFTIEEGAVVVNVPDLPAGEVNLSVASAGGSTSIPFTVLAKVPEVASFTPVEAKAGNEITVTGLFFEDVTAVKVGTKAATSFNVVSETELTFVIASGSETGKISVTTALGTGESSDNLSVIQTLPLPHLVYGGTGGSEGLNASWEKWGGWGTSAQDMASTEQAQTGTKSIKIAYNDPWGGFQLHPTNPSPFSLEGVTKVKLSLYGAAGSGGAKVAVYIKAVGAGDPPDSNKKEFTLVEGAWTTFEANLSELGDPESINELVLQNRGTVITVYVDNVELL